jgi:hypothetical protein
MKGDLFTDSYGILAGRSNYFFQLLNVHGINDIRQAEIHTAGPLVPGSTASEIELDIKKVTNHQVFIKH